jgi:hypothetical protein
MHTVSSPGWFCLIHFFAVMGTIMENMDDFTFYQAYSFHNAMTIHILPSVVCDLRLLNRVVLDILIQNVQR